MSKWHKHNDPHLSLESSRYTNPIPSRQFILDYLEYKGNYVTWEVLCKALSLKTEQEQDAVYWRLRAMEREGQLLIDDKERFKAIDKSHLIIGTVVVHRSGHGLIQPEDGSQDIYIPARYMQGILPGDRVSARDLGLDSRERRRGAIIDILEHARPHLAGRFVIEGKMCFVVPDNKDIKQDILIPPGQHKNAKRHQLVIVELSKSSRLHGHLVGKVIEVLGSQHSPGIETELAIQNYGLPAVWPKAVVSQAKRLAKTVSEKDIKDRVDIRHLPLVTIDGEDARDFDDAVYCEPSGKEHWKLMVAIADVSHYVTPDSAIDEEAYQRGTSVYFPNRVVPMLPEALSNELCSLKPKVDRLALVCEMRIDSHGKVQESQFYNAVMHSKARLTYTDVATLLEGDDSALCKKYSDVLPHLHHLYQLYHALSEARAKRQALDFDTVETRIIFDDAQKIKAIVPTVRNEAHRLIEECMLCANVAAATLLQKHKLPTLYRNHAGPNNEKLTDIRAYLKELNLGLRGGDMPQPKHYSELLHSIANRTDAHVIQIMVLRSMMQAIYEVEPQGHFGLAYDVYTHFTSPIRRYPDLLVHRTIKYILSNRAPDKYYYSQGDMQSSGQHCSLTERRAEKAARDAADWLKCAFMQDKIGEEYTASITGITGFGLFAQLQDIYIEGLVHIATLKDDYYVFEAAKQRLVGERTRRAYRLGDSLRVQLVKVNLDNRQIDLEIIESNKNKKKKSSGHKRKVIDRKQKQRKKNR